MPPKEGACVPSVVIAKALADSIRANLASGVLAEISRGTASRLTGSVASTTGRGPSYDYNQIKPDISAPGASISALVGTGSGEEAFSGTSGSAPMVSGAAALMLEAYPNRSPWAIKAALMNTADPEFTRIRCSLPNVARANHAHWCRGAAGQQGDRDHHGRMGRARRTGSLSFGYRNVSDVDTFVRTVRVQNYSRSARRYDISNAFRYDNDAASGAVKILTPGSIFVPPLGIATFDVVMRIDASRLPVWGLSAERNSGNGPFAADRGVRRLRDAEGRARHRAPALARAAAPLLGRARRQSQRRDSRQGLRAHGAREYEPAR